MARQIVVEIVGDASKYSKTLDEAQGKSKKFGSIVTGIGVGIGASAFSLATDAVQALVGEIGNAVDNASKLQQSAGAVQSVFGKAAGKIEAFGETASRALGLSKNQVNEMAAVMGAQLQGMGFEASEAADRTMTLQKRAADMAATFGGSTKDAVEAITSLMRGERDPIEKFGVSIKQADVNARILALGLDTSTAAAQKNAEAVAAMDLLMEQTAKTEGTFAAESGSLAGQQQIMAAQMENASAAIGEKLMPVFVEIQKFILSSVIPAVETLIGWFSEIVDAVGPIIAAIGKELAPVFANIMGMIKNDVIPIIQKLIHQFSGPLQVAFDLISTVVIPFFQKSIGNFIKIIQGVITFIQGVFSGDWKKAWAGIQQAFGGVIDQIGNIIKTFVSYITGLPGRLAKGLGTLFSPLWEGFRKALNNIIRGWNSLKFTVPSIDMGPLGRIGGFTLGTPNLPYFHQGGIVPGAPGTDVPIMAQAGEQIIPANQVGRGNVTINIYGDVFGDSIEELSRQIAFRLRTTGG